MEEIREQVEFVRGRVRGYLEDAVVGGAMELNEAKEVAVAANGLLNREITGEQVLLSAVGELKRLHPGVAKFLDAFVLDWKWEMKRREVEEKVLPLVLRGDLDEALALLRQD